MFGISTIKKRGIIGAFALLSMTQALPANAQSAETVRDDKAVEAMVDLPDRAPYGVNGEYFDLGYQPATQRYVLFRRDRTIPLDDVQLAAISKDLGYDPVQRWKEQTEFVRAEGTMPAYMWGLILLAVAALAAAGYWLWKRGQGQQATTEAAPAPEATPGMEVLQDRIDGPQVPKGMRVEKQKRGGLM